MECEMGNNFVIFTHETIIKEYIVLSDMICHITHGEYDGHDTYSVL